MSWARLDDGFHAHPNTVVAGLEANGLFARALSYAAHYLTDGFVPYEWMQAQVPATRTKPDVRGIIDQLLAVDALKRIDGGYQIVGYLDFNPSRVEVTRRKDSDRKRRNG